MRKRLQFSWMVPIIAAVIGMALVPGPAPAAQVLSIIITASGPPAQPSPTTASNSTAGPITAVVGAPLGNFATASGTSLITFQNSSTINVDLSASGTATLDGSGNALGGTLTYDLQVTGLSLGGVLNAFESITGSVVGGAGQTVREQLLVNGSVVPGVDQTFTSTGGTFLLPTPNTLGGSVNAGAAPITLDLIVTWFVPVGTSGASFGISLSSDARGGLSVAPEPSSLALALTSVPLLGLGAWARRRKAKA